MTYSLGETTTIIVSSKNRLNKATTTPNLFDVQFDLPVGNNYNRVCVLSAKIPHSFYQVLDNTSGNGRGNRFDFDVDGVSTEITIPVGNYTKHGIAQVLTEKLHTVRAGSTCTFPDDTTETQTGKLTFNIPSDGVEQISFIFAKKSFYLTELMGFDIGKIKTLTVSITYDTGGTPVDKTFEISVDDDTTPTSLATQIQNNLNNVFINVSIFTVSYDGGTKKLTFTNDTADFEIVIGSTEHDIGRFLGFAVGTTNTSSSLSLVSTNTISLEIYGLTKSTTATITSDNVIHTRVPHTISIGSDLIHEGKKRYNLQELNTTGAEDGFNDMVFQQDDIEGNSRTLKTANNKTHAFYLSYETGADNGSDETESFIDMNGVDWSCKLLFYRKNNEPLFQMSKIRMENQQKIDELKKTIQKTMDKKEEKEVIIEKNELIQPVTLKK